MNRRGFLSNLLAGAATVLGCGMAATKAEAAEVGSAPIFGPDMQSTGYVIRDDYESGQGTWLVSPPVTRYTAAPGLYTRYSYPIITGEDLAQAQADAIAEARAESRLAEGLPLERGALTFDAMQADCAALGCALAWWEHEDGPSLTLTHIDSQGRVVGYAGNDWSHLDAWRRSLHEAAVRQKDLGTQIAESRQLRGARPLFPTG